MPEIIATYERVSTLRQETSGFGLATQRHDLEKLIASKPDWFHPPHLTWTATGSGADENLPELHAMLDAARGSEFDILLVPTIDRLGRNMRSSLFIEEQLRRYSVRVVYLTLPDADESAEADLLRNLLRSFAEFERRLIIRRTNSGKRTKARQDRVVGVGRAPYGYRYAKEAVGNGERVASLEFDPDTEPIAREILRRLPTESAVAIRDDLNAREVPAPRAAAWNHHTIQQIGRSRTYAGEWAYGKDQVDRKTGKLRPGSYDPIIVQVPAMISEADHAVVVHGLAERNTLPMRRARNLTIDGQPVNDPYILRGMLRCSACGGPLKTAINNGHRYYLCGRGQQHAKKDQRCPLPNMPAEAVEAELTRILQHTLLNPDALARAMDTWEASQSERVASWQERHAKIEREVTRARRRLDTVIDQLIDSGTSEIAGRLRVKAQEIEAEIERLTASMHAAAPASQGTPTITLAEIQERYALETAGELAPVFGQACSPEVRRYAQAFGVRGTVALGTPEDGVKLGRRHHFRIDWTAGIPLTLPSGKVLLKSLNT